jgi:sporulation protein YlmC with PRC-barrel domain
MKSLAVLALAASVVAPAIAAAQTSTPPSGQPGASSQPSQTSSESSPSASSATSGMQGLQVQSKSLVGSTVRNRDGKDIGKVTNLLIDPSQGRINGVVVSMGGTAGFGAQEITVPWSALQVARDQQNLVVTLQQELLQQAPQKAEDRKNNSEGSASPGSQDQRRR